MLQTILKRFDSPDEILTFDKGKFEIVQLAGMPIGRAFRLASLLSGVGALAPTRVAPTTPPSFRAKRADAFSSRLAPARRSARGARNLSSGPPR